MTDIRVAVIGTVFVDCKGLAYEHYRPEGRNLGRVEFVHGGVGRNVAENLAYLETPVTFVSTVDESGLGQEIRERLQKNGVAVDYLLNVSDSGMGMWLVIVDEKGNVAGSISHMPDLKPLQKWLEDRGEALIREASHIALELDLNESIAEHVLKLARRERKPVYGLPGNLDIVMKRPDLLDELACFICNEHEAGQLWGQTLSGDDPESVLDPLHHFLKERKLSRMVVTLGANGAVYCDRERGEAGYCPAEKVEPVDTSGAGDAFFSGTVAGLCRGLDLESAVRIGTKAAAWTIRCEESTYAELGKRLREDETCSMLWERTPARGSRRLDEKCRQEETKTAPS